MKKSTIFIIIFAVILIGVIAYFLMRNKADNKETTTTTKTTSGLAGLNLGSIIGAFTGGGNNSGGTSVQPGSVEEMPTGDGWGNFNGIF